MKQHPFDKTEENKMKIGRDGKSCFGQQRGKKKFFHSY